VEARLAVGVGRAPLSSNQAALLQAHQRGIEGAHVELQRAAGNLLQPRGNRVAVERTEGAQGPEHHQIERALEDVGPGSPSIRHANGILQSLEDQMESTVAVDL